MHLARPSDYFGTTADGAALPQFTVGGTVHDMAGRPISGATIVALDSAGDERIVVRADARAAYRLASSRPLWIQAVATEMASVSKRIPEGGGTIDLELRPTSTIEVGVSGIVDEVIAQPLFQDGRPLFCHRNARRVCRFEDVPIGDYGVYAPGTHAHRVMVTADGPARLMIVMPPAPVSFTIHVAGTSCSAVELRGAVTVRHACASNEARFAAVPGDYVACIGRYCEQIVVTWSSTWFELDVH